jgi:hypothetical protein
MADAAIDLFGMIATISRVDTKIRQSGAESAEGEIRICNTFCEQAWRRVRRNLLMVDNNSDTNIKAIADAVIQSKEYPFTLIK